MIVKNGDAKVCRNINLLCDENGERCSKEVRNAKQIWSIAPIDTVGNCAVKSVCHHFLFHLTEIVAAVSVDSAAGMAGNLLLGVCAAK